jgi:Ca2+-binding RTX toxin-like protein
VNLNREKEWGMGKLMSQRATVFRTELRVEELDHRVVPTVGALGTLEGNFLTVTGDDSANEIYLRRVVGTDGVERVQIDGGIIQTIDGPVAFVTVDELAGFFVVAGGGDDTVIVDPALGTAGMIDLGAGNDVGAAGAGPVDLFGGAGADLLFGGPSADHLYGQDGNDVLYGGGGSDVGYGGRDADLFGPSVSTVADFTNGFDQVLDDDAPAPTLPAATPPAFFTPGPLAEPALREVRLVGDVLLVNGTSGNDTFTTGNFPIGNARRLLDGSGSTIPIQTDTGFVTSFTTVSGGGTVRAVIVRTFGGADSINFGNLDAPQVLLGGSGADTIVAGGSVTRGRPDEVRVFGGAGADNITTPYGSGPSLSVYAGAGDDYVYVGSATVWGGSGNDQLIAGGWPNVFFGETGNDLLVGFADDSGVNILFGGAGDDTLIGGFIDGVAVQTVSNLLLGGDGNDVLYAGYVSDPSEGFLAQNLLDGGNGDDLLVGTGGFGGVTTFVGGAGYDTAEFVGPDDTLFPDVEQVI